VTVLDLFAGAGGASEGLAALGLEHVGVELDPVAAGTAVAARHRRVVDDVARLNPRDFPDVTGLWASPPCTTFSSAGSGAGRRVMDVLADGIIRTVAGERVMDRVRQECARALEAHALTDPKLAKLTPVERSEWAARQATVSALVVEVARYARDLRPEWVACEQVPGVLPLWRVLARALRGAGYRAWCGVLCAANYGVPQARHRAILVASRIPAHRVGPPEPTHAEHPGDGDLFGPPLPGWVSMATALGLDWPDRAAWPVSAGGTDAGGAEVFADRRTWSMRNGSQSRATERGVDEPAGTVYSSRSTNLRWTVTRPATTASETVRVSVAEAACLQSFRVDFPWRGTRTTRYRQVGNAVPPPLAAAVVGHLLGVDWPPIVAAYLARSARAPDREAAS